MKITKFGRNEHRMVSERIIDALKTLENELGLTFQADGGSISTGGGKIHLKVDLKDVGNGQSGAEANFTRYAPLVGAAPGWFDQTFWMKGTQYRVAGINTNAHKYPIECERVVDGKLFKFPLATVRHLLAGSLTQKVA